MNKKERIKHVEKTHGRKATASKLAEASSTTKNIKMYISLALTALVIIIIASIFLNSIKLLPHLRLKRQQKVRGKRTIRIRQRKRKFKS